ncbi:fungal-specific transcription factor domain-containing protein [Lineolata rhizophorae]|uniref:Fungal-specific transcription factor domain-containing protein n=1 Tax=Lineolata rhizophorae TaxID=578093 RepID=A0A6A6P9L1_9PEZI|nr:fungal-specific transcription factor domain-containing protein [Lineolata rhizophorae]
MSQKGYVNEGANIDNANHFWSNVNASDPYRPNDDIVFDDIFQPDTASSFNMPFTTMNNYSWLFDLNSSCQQYGTSAQADFNHSGAHPPDFNPTVSAVSIDPNALASPTSLPSCSDAQIASIISPHSISEGNSHRIKLPSVRDAAGIGDDVPPSVDLFAKSTHDYRPGEPRMCIEPSLLGPVCVPAPSELLPTASINDVDRPLAMLDSSSGLPVIDEVARSEVLSVIEAARPIGPDGSLITRDNPLLSLSAMQTYCDLYFTRFNTAYPLLHRPTFDASHAETLLLVSVLLLGATYSEKDSHQIAVCVHDVLRPQIFANAGFNARPDLWVLQTILLVECFGKSRAGQKQHDMAHLFHGLLINLIRRSDCQTIRPPMVQDSTGDLHDDWHRWAHAEQKKRLAFLCFCWDVEHAELFCQSLCMSAFELRSNLPCSQSLWEADSAEQWQFLRREQRTPPVFLGLLKAYLTPGGQSIPKDLNALSRVILLHGLMSVAWDMRRRDQTSLGLVGNDGPIGNWKARIGRSYDLWHDDFTTYIQTSLSRLHSIPSSASSTSASSTSARITEFTAFATAITAIYHSAHITLGADILDIQIYAGARHILGRPVARPDYARSQRVVRRWAAAAGDPASESDAPPAAAAAGPAAWHAAKLLRDAVTDLKEFDAGGLFHYPWCLYLATLTVWAFYHGRPAGSVNASDDAAGVDADEDGEDEIVWDARGDMKRLVESMTDSDVVDLALLPAGKRRTIGLTAVVAKHLSKVRWAVVHDGMQVLRGLVPWRLINQCESVS